MGTVRLPFASNVRLSSLKTCAISRTLLEKKGNEEVTEGWAAKKGWGSHVADLSAENARRKPRPRIM